MNRDGLRLTVMLILIAMIVIAGGICYYLARRPNSQSTETARTSPAPTNPSSSIVTSPIQPTSSATSISNTTVSSMTQNSIAIPPNALSSPDDKWIAFENEPIVSWGTGFVYPSAEVDIVNSDRSVIRTFTPAQLYASPSCGCTVQIFGWGNGVLWLDAADSDQGIISDFIKINIADWSVTNYPTTIFEDAGSFLFGNSSIDFDTGKFVMTNIPWTPIADIGPVYSVWVYDIQTGTSQVIETTTAETAASMEESTFGSDLKWINDDTLQYYNFDLGGLATTSAIGVRDGP